MNRFLSRLLVLGNLWWLVWSGQVLAFSTHDTTLLRVPDKFSTPVGHPISVSVSFTNSETEELRGFYYSENIREDLSVSTISVRIDGVDISNYSFETGTVNDVYPGCVPYRWILETPPFDEDNPIASGTSVEIVYTVNSASAGEFHLDEFNWAGYYQDGLIGERAACGHSEAVDQETITFFEESVCNDSDADGYGDPADAACTHPELDCSDSNPHIYPTNSNVYCDCEDPDPEGATEVCEGGIDEDCDGLIDAADPDCIGQHVLEMDASFDGGTMNLDFFLGTPDPAVWGTFLIVTNPSVVVVPLWEAPLLQIAPPLDIPIDFACPSLGWVGLYTCLYDWDGIQIYDLDWVNTGLPD